MNHNIFLYLVIKSLIVHNYHTHPTNKYPHFHSMLIFEVFTGKIASIILNLPFPTHQGALGRINYSLEPLNSRKTPQNRSLFRHMRPRKRGRFEICSPTLFQQILTCLPIRIPALPSSETSSTMRSSLLEKVDQLNFLLNWIVKKDWL